MDGLNCTVAIQICYKQLHVYSLLRFGDPPLKIITSPYIDNMVLHGNLIFIRPPYDGAFHTDVINWKDEVGPPSLKPSFKNSNRHSLRKSATMLLSVDSYTREILAYTFSKDAWDSPMKQGYGRREHLVDYAANHDLIIGIFRKRDKRLIYRSFNPFKQEIIRTFVLPPSGNGTEAQLIYPYVIFQGRFFSNHREKYEFRSCASLYTQTQHPRMREHAVFGHYAIKVTPSSQSPFFFIESYESIECLVYHMDRLASFRVVADGITDSYDIAPMGLSFLFVRDRREVVFRRFCLVNEIVAI